MSIRVSQEHGVNPSLGLCFYCRKAKEVVLLGAMSPQRREKIFGPGHESYSDTPYSAAAPREAIYNMEPCDECANWMKQGVILVSYDPAKTEEGARDPWRTGGWVVLRDEAVHRMLDGKIRDQVLEKRFSFVEDEVWDKLGLPRSPEEGEDTDDDHELEGEVDEPPREPPG